MSTPRRLTAALVAALAVLGACGSDNSVGDEDALLNFDQSDADRLGVTTTTAAPAPGETTAPTAPPETAPAAAQQPSATTPPVTAPAATTPPTTPEQRAVSIEVAIRPDSAGAQFEPNVARVFTGSIVRFRNTDTVARSVQASDGTFASGPIAPGAFFDYEATISGVFDYTDGTRPYAVGSLEVLDQ